PFSGPPGFHRAWAKPFDGDRGFVKVYFAPDGRLVVVTDIGGRIELFDAKTGAAGPVLRGPTVPANPLNVWALDGDRVAVLGHPQKPLGVWDAKTGESRPDLLTAAPLPPPPPGVTGSGVDCQVSPDGRY